MSIEREAQIVQGSFWSILPYMMLWRLKEHGIRILVPIEAATVQIVLQLIRECSALAVSV